MEKLMIILVIVLSLVLVILLGAITFLAYRYVKLKEAQLEQKEPSNKISPAIKEQIESFKRVEAISSYCVDHPENKARGVCSISSEPFCELCLTKQDDLKLGRKYLDLYLDSEWDRLVMIEDGELSLENLEKIRVIKDCAWSDSRRPLIIQDQFKINIEEDRIESYKVLLVRVEDKNDYLDKLSFLN